MEPVQRKKLSQSVLDRLLDAISNEEFPAGSQLPSERELMEMVGVGRPSIREAMHTLQQMGLIKINHGERARVIKPTPEAIIGQVSAAMVVLLAANPQGLEELKSARIMIEVGLARMAAERAHTCDITALEAELEAMRAAQGDAQSFVAHDMKFHEIIAQMSGNSLIAAAVSGILGWLSEFKQDLVLAKGAEAVTLAEHEELLQAIRAGDADAAGRAMQRHLSRASDLYAVIS